MNDTNDWNYWNSIDSFRVHHGMSLVKGFLPPREVSLLPYEEAHAWHHSITTMASYETDFDRILQSLRADPQFGVEFRRFTNVEAAYAHIPRNIFIHHWRKCGFAVHEKLKVEGMGRPKKADKDEVLQIAKEYAVNEADYAQFLKAVATKYGYEMKTVRGLVAKKKYIQLILDSSKQERKKKQDR